MDKKVKGVAITLIGMNLFYFILDYFNIPTNFGLNMSKINWDIAALVISNAIVIGLYLITFLLIDKRNLINHKNKKDIAKHTLLDVYNECKITVNTLNIPEYSKRASEQCDRDKLFFQDPVMQKYLNAPFENKDLIVNYAQDGIISKKVYASFLTVQKKYKQHIIMRITFFDEANLPVYSKDEVLEEIKKAEDLLNGDDF